MLRSFRLGNHRSFREPHELLLMPVLRAGRAKDDRPVVPVIAVFGANAAGKSNLLDGLRFMTQAVRDSYRRWDREAGVPRKPFRLDSESAALPSVFVVDLLIDGLRYVYGFEIDDERVHTEWLYTYPHSRKRVLFEREADEVRFGTTVPSRKAASEVFTRLIRPDALFLSLAAQLDVPDLLPVYQWFAHGLRWAGSSASTRQGAAALLWYLDRFGDQKRVLDLIRAADVGISEYFIDEDETLAASLQRRRAAMIAQADVDLALAQLSENDGSIQEAERQRARIVRIYTGSQTARRLRFMHGSCPEPFDPADESDGTRSWLALLPEVLVSLDTGAVMIVDEIDSSLHPQLTAQLIRLYQSGETNPRNAQLIFTTHDASLLGTSFGEDLMDRDQVWFVEKDVDGASKLYPLSDFHPRKGGENRERRYLSGSYGAVPVISESAFAAAVMRPSPRTEAS